MAMFAERGFDRRSVETERGRVQLYALTPTVQVVVVSGHMDPGMAEAIVTFSTDRMSRTPTKQHVFYDWLDMTSYDSACRSRLTTFSKEHLDRVAEVHIAQSSKLVAMGVQVANIALGSKIETHADRASLERALARVYSEPGHARR